MNRYSYVLNNPLIYTDPSGHGNFWKDLGDQFVDLFSDLLGAVLCFSFSFNDRGDFSASSNLFNNYDYFKNAITGNQGVSGWSSNLSQKTLSNGGNVITNYSINAPQNMWNNTYPRGDYLRQIGQITDRTLYSARYNTLLLQYKAGRELSNNDDRNNIIKPGENLLIDLPFVSMAAGTVVLESTKMATVDVLKAALFEDLKVPYVLDKIFTGYETYRNVSYEYQEKAEHINDKIERLRGRYYGWINE